VIATKMHIYLAWTKVAGWPYHTCIKLGLLWYGYHIVLVTVRWGKGLSVIGMALSLLGPFSKVLLKCISLTILPSFKAEMTCNSNSCVLLK